MSSPQALPRWADVFLMPVLNLAIAMAAAAVVVLFVGQNPR
jgi:simple sugar transport system permease protein